jgi:hypothetical protein
MYCIFFKYAMTYTLRPIDFDQYLEDKVICFLEVL